MLNKISTSTFRWIAKRKADLIARIDSGEISEAEALRLHHLSPEELAEWRRCYAEDGVWGLMEKQIARRKLRQSTGTGKTYYGAEKGKHRASLPGQPPASWDGPAGQ